MGLFVSSKKEKETWASIVLSGIKPGMQIDDALLEKVADIYINQHGILMEALWNGTIVFLIEAVIQLHGSVKSCFIYYRATLSMCQSMRQIAKNFADEARAQMEKEENPEYLENLKEIAQAAEVVPYHPANSFYEALCTILFIKEMAIDLEGVAVAVMGHIDRILYPFYERDIKDGTLTYEKAKNYMAHWLSHTDGRWDLYGNDFASTNCSITIGGCDSQGNIIWNDITRMICIERSEETKTPHGS